MATRKKRLKRPIKAKINGFTWKVEYVDLDHDNFGETDKSQKKIYIYTKGKSEQIVSETLLHEIGHAVMDDLADVIFHLDYDKNYDKEEQLIRLLCPRIFQFMQENPDFFHYWLDTCNGDV